MELVIIHARSRVPDAFDPFVKFQSQPYSSPLGTPNPSVHLDGSHRLKPPPLVPRGAPRRDKGLLQEQQKKVAGASFDMSVP